MKIKTHEDLEVYQIAFKAAREIFELSKKFSSEEKYSLTHQIRPFSRSVCANLAEAWRERKYKAAEVQVWLKFAFECGYLEIDVGRNLYKDYNRNIRKFNQHDEQCRQMDFVTSLRHPVPNL